MDAAYVEPVIQNFCYQPEKTFEKRIRMPLNLDCGTYMWYLRNLLSICLQTQAVRLQNDIIDVDIDVTKCCVVKGF